MRVRMASWAWLLAIGGVAWGLGCGGGNGGGDGADAGTALGGDGAGAVDGASQDVAADAVAVDASPPDDLGLAGDGCPGLQREQDGECVPISVGSAKCAPEAVGACKDFKATLSCLAGADGFPSGIAQLRAIFVDDDYAGVDGQDGSRQRPFGTIGEALAAMTDETEALVLAPGTYTERIAIVGRPDFQVLGAGECHGERTRIEVEASADSAVRIEDSPRALVRGLTLNGGQAPLRLAGDVAEVTVERMVIAGANGDAVAVDGAGAQGAVLREIHIRAPVQAGCAVRLTSTTGVLLDRISIDNPAGPGVCATNSGALTVRNVSVRKAIVAALLLENTEATVDGFSARAGNGGGGIAAVGEAAQATVRGCLIEAAVGFGLYAGQGAALDVDGCYVGGTLGNPPDQGYGAVATEAATATLRHVWFDGAGGPAVGLFGPGQLIPQEDPPADAAAAAMRVLDVRIDGPVLAGVYARGVTGVLLDDVEVQGVGPAPEGIESPSAGVAGLWSSVTLSRLEVQGSVDFGAVFTEAKARVRDLMAGEATAATACSEPLCANVDVGDGPAPASGAARVTDGLEAPSAPGF